MMDGSMTVADRMRRPHSIPCVTSRRSTDLLLLFALLCALTGSWRLAVYWKLPNTSEGGWNTQFEMGAVSR